MQDKTANVLLSMFTYREVKNPLITGTTREPSFFTVVSLNIFYLLSD